MPKASSIPQAGPYILAIETATRIGSVALFSGPQLLGHIDIRREKSHARLLTPMIETLLKDLQIKPADLAAIGVARGPGSYTGLRVGVSTAKGLCMALDKPLLSISSLEGLAWQVQEVAERLGAWICPMIDARRMEVYCEVFDPMVQSKQDVQALIVDESAFADILKGQSMLFLGDGAAKCEPVIGQHPHAIFLSQTLSSAAAMGKALFRKFEQEAFEDLITFEPFYLKDFVATKPRDRLRG